MNAPAAPRSAAAVTARAGTNIALVKYWGKRDLALNLPAAGSLSLTLASLGTTTRVRFAPEGDSGGGDRVLLDGSPAEPGFAQRVCRFLDLVRVAAKLELPAEVRTSNSVPTAAGLASSASGFAALCLAATRAAGLDLPPAALSALARRGSGSAARSIFGGFVEMARGERLDGNDAVARPLASADVWDVRLVVVLTASGRKPMGSTLAMEHTARTSPYYPAWIASVDSDLAEARAAVLAHDLDRLGAVAERSALRMHASMLGADPPLLYWNPATIAAMQAVVEARRTGLRAYFTVDAGPHVKVLCATADAAAVQALLGSVPGVLHTIVAAPGPGAMVLEEERA
jgi:diphosphomevalonate decarboxylase